MYLLDDGYFNFMLAGRREGGGLTWIGEDRLIPLKAHAWLDLSARKERGEPVDSKNIRFLQRLMADGTYSPASLGIDNPVDEIVRRISQAYETAPA